jgi:hypothetical protein
MLGKLCGIGIAALLVINSPAQAELTTVAANEVVTAAKPLQVQKVNKGRIWLLFVLGASSLFGATILLENNETWFPAISRANRAMAQSMKAAKAKEERDMKELEENKTRLINVESERLEDARLEDAVMSGLEEAQRPEVREEVSSNGALEGEGTQTSWEDEGVIQSKVSKEGLFEIGPNDIEASFEMIQHQTKVAKEQVLENLSLEELEREIVQRKARDDDTSLTQ